MSPVYGIDNNRHSGLSRVVFDTGYTFFIQQLAIRIAL